jgi:hypothetical protein
MSDNELIISALDFYLEHGLPEEESEIQRESIFRIKKNVEDYVDKTSKIRDLIDQFLHLELRLRDLRDQVAKL